MGVEMKLLVFAVMSDDERQRELERTRLFDWTVEDEVDIRFNYPFVSLKYRILVKNI